MFCVTGRSRSRTRGAEDKNNKYRERECERDTMLEAAMVVTVMSTHCSC